MKFPKYFLLFWAISSLLCYDSRKVKHFSPGKSCGGNAKIHFRSKKGLQKEAPECGFLVYDDPLEFKKGLNSGSWSSFGSWSSCDVSCGEGIRTRTRTCSGSGPKPICPGRALESEKCSNLSCLDCFDFEIDYYGPDVTAKMTDSVELCKLFCQEVDSCLHYSWRQDMNNKCFLKTSSSGKQPWAGSISGPKVCNGDCLHYSTNSPGTIWSEKHFDTPEECQFDCYKNRMICSHFTFYTKGHSDQTYHRMCRQFSSVLPNSTFLEAGCIFGPNHC